MEPPSRPTATQESAAMRLFLALSPRLPWVAQPDPPDELRPCEEVTVRRPGGREALAGTWFPAAEAARGAVLLLPPWLAWGRSYFHRRGRIEALRASGYHALTLDLPGRDRRTEGFFDRDVEAGLDELRKRAGSLPLHVWGVSAGGYWAHPVLARTDGVAGAFFEDVAPHLLEWSWRIAPLGRPFYLFFRSVLRSSYRFLDMRRHAEAFSLRAVAYVGGAKDPGVRPADTRELAARARGRCHIVDRAGHLDAIKVANQEVLAMALETFAQAEEGTGAPSGSRSGPVFESDLKTLEVLGVARHKDCVPLPGEDRNQQVEIGDRTADRCRSAQSRAASSQSWNDTSHACQSAVSSL